jgi:hypothetical protein
LSEHHVLFQIGKTATERHKILESVCGMKVYLVCLCLNGLRDWGVHDLEDYPRTGQLLTPQNLGTVAEV